jgi:hypothetical protein
MPSPRPSGLGVWKILLFPQRLHDGVFGFIVFIGYVFEPIICFLLWVSVVRNYTCNLFVFVSFCLSSLTWTLTRLPLSLLGGLSAIPDHMSWFLTAITDDFPSVSILSLSFPSVVWFLWDGYFCSCKSGPSAPQRCVHSIRIPMGWCDALPLLLGVADDSSLRQAKDV